VWLYRIWPQVIEAMVPSPTWRTFLRNHLPDIAAIEMFVFATATYRLLLP
jgi:hypothetical protein